MAGTRVVRCRQIIWLIVTLAAVVGLSSCGSLGAPARYRIDLTSEPSPPRSGQITRLQARVADEAGAPVVGARVRLQSEHLGMTMGSLTVDGAEIGSGVYEASVNLAMSGGWKTTVMVDGAAGRAQREFELYVIPGR